MVPVSASELASIQVEVAAAACDLSCQIERSSISYGTGGATVTWPVISAVGLLCGMTEPTANQLTNYEYMIGSLAAWHVRFPVVTMVNGQPIATDVKQLDRVVITAKNGAVYTLSVVKLLQPRSYTALISILATE